MQRCWDHEPSLRPEISGVSNVFHGVREFANNNLILEQSRRRAAYLLNSKELPRDLRELTPEDQAKFVDKVDQVC